MSEIIKIKNLHLAHTKEGNISISHIEKPYGDFSEPVARIAISLHENEKSTSIDIPYENLDELINSLTRARSVCNNMNHNDIHAELLSDVGGGQ